VEKCQRQSPKEEATGRGERGEKRVEENRGEPMIVPRILLSGVFTHNERKIERKEVDAADSIRSVEGQGDIYKKRKLWECCEETYLRWNAENMGY